MKRYVPILLSFGAPLLVVLALSASQHRQGSDKVQAWPALLVGTGLIISSAVGRRRQRARLLTAFRSSRVNSD